MNTTTLLQQALDALETGYYQGTQEAIKAIRAHLAQPQPEPVAIADGTFNCGAPLGTPLYAQPMSEVVVHVNYREMWRQTLEDNQRLCAVLAAQPAPVPVPPGMALVSLEFVQGFLTMAHNYCLRAIPPDYYSGTEADAFQHAYSRCGSDLRKLRDLIAASPEVP